MYMKESDCNRNFSNSFKLPLQKLTRRWAKEKLKGNEKGMRVKEREWESERVKEREWESERVKNREWERDRVKDHRVKRERAKDRWKREKRATLEAEGGWGSELLRVIDKMRVTLECDWSKQIVVLSLQQQQQQHQQQHRQKLPVDQSLTPITKVCFFRLYG